MMVNSQPASSSTTRLKIQTKTFTNWVNAQLTNVKINDLASDFKDGTNLLALVRALLAKNKHSLPLNNQLLPERPNSALRIHHILNVGKALHYVGQVSGAPFQSLGPEDIVDGNEKMTLAMVWGLIVRFQLGSIDFANDSSDPQFALLNWVKHTLTKTTRYSEIVAADPPVNFLAAWRSGRLFIALVHALCPHGFEFTTPDLQFILHSPTVPNVLRLTLAFQLANEFLGVKQLLDPHDVAVEDQMDERSIVTYISSIYLANETISRTGRPKFESLLSDFIDTHNITIDLDAMADLQAPKCQDQMSLLYENVDSMRASVDNIALEFPNIKQRVSVLDAHQLKLTEYRAEYNEIVHSMHSVSNDSLTLMSPELSSHGSVPSPVLPALIPLPLSPLSSPSPSPDQNSCAHLSKTTKQLLRDVSRLIQSAKHACAIELVLQDFHVDYSSCITWLTDTTRSYDIQIKSLTNTLSSFPSSTEFNADEITTLMTTVRDLRTWISMINPHIIEFYTTFNALSSTSNNLMAHFSQSPMHTESLATVETKFTHVRSMWDALRAKYDLLKREYMDSRLSQRIVQVSEYLVHYIDEYESIRINVHSDLTHRIQSTPTSPQGLSPYPSPTISFAELSVKTAFSVMEHWRPKLHALIESLTTCHTDTYTDVFTPDPPSQETEMRVLLINAGVSLGNIVVSLQNKCIDLKSALAQQYQHQRHAHLMENWNAVHMYATEIRDSLPGLQWTISETPSLLETDIFSQISKSTISVHDLVARVAAYDTRTVRKLERSTSTYLPDLSKDLSDQVLGVQTIAMETWQTLATEIANLEAMYASKAWVPDALQALCNIEAMLSSADEIVAVHAGKRKSRLSLNDMRNRDIHMVVQPVLSEAVDLTSVLETLADTDAGLTDISSTYPDLDSVDVLKLHFERLSKLLGRNRRIVNKINEHRAKAMRAQKRSALVHDITQELASVPTRLAMVNADLSALEDPLVTKVTADLTPYRSTISDADHALSSAQSMLVEYDAIPLDDEFQVQDGEANARSLIQKTEKGIGQCSKLLDTLDSKLYLVKESSDLLDEAELLLRRVNVSEIEITSTYQATSDLKSNQGHIDKAAQTLNSILTCPAVLHNRHTELQSIQGLLDGFVKVSMGLLSNDTLEADMLFSLDEAQPNVIVPSRSVLPQLVSENNLAQNRLDLINVQVTDWISALNKVVTTAHSDEVKIFSDLLNEAKTFVMRVSMLASEAMDQRNAACNLATRIIGTDEQGRDLLGRINADDGRIHSAHVTEYTAWRDDSRDLMVLFLPLQALQSKLNGALASSSDRAMRLVKHKLVGDRLNEIMNTVIPPLVSCMSSASDQLSVALVKSTADEVASTIDPILVEITDSEFSGHELHAPVKEKLDNVNAEMKNLRELVSLAQSFVSVAASVHSFVNQIRLARENLLAESDSSESESKVVTYLDVKTLESDVLGLKASNAHLMEQSSTLSSRFDALSYQIDDLFQVLAVSIKNRESHAYYETFEIQADKASQAITRVHVKLTDLLNARQSTDTTPSTSELEKLDDIATELENVKSDVSALVSLGSGHSELSKSMYINPVMEREQLVQMSMSAVLQLYATVKSTKQREYKEDHWHYEVSVLTSKLSALLDELKKINVNLDTVEASVVQLANVQDEINSALAQASVLKKEAHGDTSALSTLSMIVSRRVTSLQQAQSECQRICKVIAEATELAEFVDACAIKVPVSNDLKEIAVLAVDVESYEDGLKQMIESEAKFVITSKANAELVNGTFSDLQKSISVLATTISERRRDVEDFIDMQNFRVKADEFVSKVRAAVDIQCPSNVTMENYEKVPVEYASAIKSATLALDDLNNKYDDLTLLANGYLDKMTTVVPLRLLLTELLTEWTKACDVIKQNTEKLGAISSISGLLGNFVHMKSECERIESAVQSIQTNTNEASIATAQLLLRDATALKDDTSSAASKFRTLLSSNSSVIANESEIKTVVDNLQEQTAVLYANVHATQTTLFKANQLLASCAELQQQCEVILETAKGRHATVNNDLFYSMDPGDAEKFVEAAFTVHQNALGDVERLRSFRGKLQADHVFDPTHVSQDFQDRIQLSIKDVDGVLSQMNGTIKKETDQIELLRRVYHHMRSAQQITTWFNAARSALDSLQSTTSYSEHGPTLQSSTVDEIRGKMVSFNPTVDKFIAMTLELNRFVDQQLIRDRSEQIKTEWDELNSIVTSLGQKAVVSALHSEFYGLCDEMEEVMQSYRREIQIVSQNAERIDKDTEVGAMVTKLREFSKFISETMDPQVERLTTILKSEHVTGPSLEQLSKHFKHVHNQVKSLQNFVKHRIDLIQASKETRGAFDLLGEIKQLLTSTQSLLDEVHVEQVAMQDIDRTIASVQQRQAQFASKIERLFDMVNQSSPRPQVLARRDLLLQQWRDLGEDSFQIMHDLQLRKKVLFARSERVRETRQSIMSSSSSDSSSSLRSFLPRPSTPSVALYSQDAYSSPRKLTPGFSQHMTSSHNQVPKPIFYKSDPKDPLDMRMASAVNELGVFVKITRQAPGKYLFGDVEGKIVNCKLVKNTIMVRVGGGFKDIRDYLIELDVAKLLVKSETVISSKFALVHQ